MKKYLLILAVAAIPFGMQTAKAQTFPVISAQQDDMEVWTKDGANSSAYDPNTGFNVVGWECLNALSSPIIGGPPHPVSVFKDSTTVYSGRYSAKIVSVVYNSTAYGYVQAFVPHDTLGVILLGTITPTPSIVPGAPFTAHIGQFTFWYQYAPQQNSGKNDTASCTVLLTRQIHPNTISKVIASGSILMNSAASWTNGIVNLTYDTTNCNPDTIQVFFASSSRYAPAPGSILWIDGVAPLNVNEVVNGQLSHITVYPNPANNEVNFSFAGEIARNVEVYDITGRKVNSYSVKDFALNVNTSSYQTGEYIYQVFNKQGQPMKTGKFSVQR